MMPDMIKLGDPFSSPIDRWDIAWESCLWSKLFEQSLGKEWVMSVFDTSFTVSLALLGMWILSSPSDRFSVTSLRALTCSCYTSLLSFKLRRHSHWYEQLLAFFLRRNSGCFQVDEIGRRGLLLSGTMMMIIFALIALVINSAGHLENFEIFPNPIALTFSVYLMKYFYSGFLCFFCCAYYFSFGLWLTRSASLANLDFN